MHKNKNFQRALTAVLACLGVASLSLSVAAAQTTQPATTQAKTSQPKKSTTSNNPWTPLAKLPNFTEGVWGTGGPGAGPAGLPNAGKTMPPLKAQAATNAVPAGETCLPLGMPTVMQRPYPFEFIYAPGRITMLLELDGQVRRIYTDGRPHPDDPDLSYGGHSIGHWEQDTLVVDTVGILPEVQIAPRIPASGPTHIVERIHLTAPDALTIDTTIDAPMVLTQPWSYSITYQRHRDWEVQEYFCAQNPR